MYRIFLIIALLSYFPNFLIAEKVWKQKHYIKNENLYLEAVDSNCCYAFADDQSIPRTDGSVRIYYSSDQGGSWSEIYSHEVGNTGYDSKSFMVAPHCHALDSNHLYITYFDGDISLDIVTEHGKKMERISFEEFAKKDWDYTIAFKMYNSRIGVLLTNHELFYTFNGWLDINRYEYQDDIERGTYPIFFVDSNNVAIEAYFNEDNYFINFNLPTEEISLYSNPDTVVNVEYPRVFTDIDFINDSLGFAAGFQKYSEKIYAKDIIWKTINRGQSWEIVWNNLVPESRAATKLDFENEYHGFAVGNYGKVMETFDGGYNWTYYEEEDLPLDFVESMGQQVVILGQHILIYSLGAGIYRYEEANGVEEIFNDIIINTRKEHDNFIITIEDDLMRPYQIDVYNMLGNYITSSYINPGDHSTVINIPKMNKAVGMYLYFIKSNDFLVKTGKFFVK